MLIGQFLVWYGLQENGENKGEEDIPVLKNSATVSVFLHVFSRKMVALI